MSFQVRQEKFEGPLELLLDLIEKEKLAISEISLAKVADEYMVYIRSSAPPDPEELAEFLVVAAQLMLIKSRAILPQLTLPADEEASIGDLEQRLAQLARFRGLVKELRQLEGQGLRIASREAYLGLGPVFYPSPKLAPTALSQALRAFIETLPKIERIAEEKMKHVISLQEQISHIRELLQNVIERGFSEIVQGAKEKVKIIVSFLALLELAQQRFIELRQDQLFKEIMIRRAD